MSSHLTARIDDAMMSDLNAMAQETGITKNELVSRALRAYISSGGPDTEYTLKLAKEIGKIFGFSNSEQFYEEVSKIVEGKLKELMPEILAQAVPEKKVVVTEARIPQVPKAEINGNLKQAVKQIIDDLEAGQDVAVFDVATKHGLDPAAMSLRVGVKTVRRTVAGKRDRYYTTDKVGELKKVFESL